MDVLEERTNSIVYDDDDEEMVPFVSLKSRRLSTKKSSRRRRRSSARFLRLGDTVPEEDSKDDNVGEVYQKAIRMNAENRINATNSWNLSLIDHLDRVVAPQPISMEDSMPATGVNFTKASCTLDASVKIYSYRVDDVHLTSYKVLANLNRTETGKKRGGDSNVAASSETSENHSRVEKRKTTATDTLEQNLANINIHKLDAAFDIDPLFHKMSKTFDEGGAKGLLLANLGVSSNGCNIVFDSTLEDSTEESKSPEESDKSQESVNVSSLEAALETLLSGQAIEEIPLVPQLASLRSEFARLEEEGFVDHVAPSQRYASTEEEEHEADRSIHYEAIERSRASQADLGCSAIATDEDNSSAGGGYAPDDFGGDDDDFSGDFGIHDGDHRFSSSSFQHVFEASRPPSQATVLLDALSSGNLSGSKSNYEYFNSQALENIQGNMWAGAAHWKKLPRRKVKNKEEPPSAATTRGAKNRKGATSKQKLNTIVFDVSKPVENLEDLLRQPPKSKRGTDPLQLTKAAKTKHSKSDNLLPLDIGIGVDKLTSLFLRPNSTVSEITERKQSKAVGFGGVETWGMGGADDSFGGGDDDGGLGYDFGGDDNDDGFAVAELEGVRKVEKIKVGYATVAKKVDVKRLKRDLWIELERTFQEREETKEAEMTEDEDGETLDVAVSPKVEPEEQEGPLSFQDTVKEMKATQSQADVTLPFYFICVLHLANEKGLALESKGLEDFVIHSSG